MQDAYPPIVDERAEGLVQGSRRGAGRSRRQPELWLSEQKVHMSIAFHTLSAP